MLGEELEVGDVPYGPEQQESIENNGCWEKAPVVNGYCGTHCGDYANGYPEMGTCYSSPPVFDCQWNCKGMNEGNTPPGCTIMFNSPCFHKILLF